MPIGRNRGGGNMSARLFYALLLLIAVCVIGVSWRAAQ